MLGGPYLYARLGRFDEARDRLERSKAICRELGIAYGLAEAHMAGAEMEMLAGDAEAAERELGTRSGRDGHGRVALRRPLPHSARPVLVSQGRDEDALAELEQARESTRRRQVEDARARVLARRGQTEEAVRLAREAVASLPAAATSPRTRIPSWTSPRCSARTATRRGAQTALAEAIALHEEKGNVVAC